MVTQRLRRFTQAIALIAKPDRKGPVDRDVLELEIRAGNRGAQDKAIVLELLRALLRALMRM